MTDKNDPPIEEREFIAGIALLQHKLITDWSDG